MNRMKSQLRNYVRNISRPWKFFSFVVGMTGFILGALLLDLPTWDVGVSVIMSVLCYIFAPWAVDSAIHAFRERKGRWLLNIFLSLVVVYFVGSGSYEIYNTIRMGLHPVTYWENLLFSIPVTIAAGLLWRYDGSLNDLLQGIKRVM